MRSGEYPAPWGGEVYFSGQGETARYRQTLQAEREMHTVELPPGHRQVAALLTAAGQDDGVELRRQLGRAGTHDDHQRRTALPSICLSS